MEVIYKKLNSANVQMENVAEGGYAIKANVNVYNGKTNNFDAGEVRKGEQVVATFSKYSNPSIQYQTSDVEEMCAITTEVVAFCDACEGYVEGHSIM